MANDQFFFEKVVFFFDLNCVFKGVDEWGVIVSYVIEGIVIKFSLFVFIGECYFKLVFIVFYQLKSDVFVKKGLYVDLFFEIGVCKV